MLFFIYTLIESQGRSHDRSFRRCKWYRPIEHPRRPTNPKRSSNTPTDDALNRNISATSQAKQALVKVKEDRDIGVALLRRASIVDKDQSYH